MPSVGGVTEVFFSYRVLILVRYQLRMFCYVQDTRAPWITTISMHLSKMKNLQETKPINLVLHQSQSEQPNIAAETPIPDAGSVSCHDNKKVSRQDIEFVQNMIERCLKLYMNRDEVVKALLNRARIDPRFTKLVWQKLEEENADFFRAYYIRLILKRQIIIFNHLLERQNSLRQYLMAPNVHLAPIPVNNLPMGYPVMQETPIPATGQPHGNPMLYSTPSCHVVNGVPAPGNFHPMRMNSGNDMIIDTSAADVSSIGPTNNAMSSISDMNVSPTSVASNGHFPFSVSGMRVETSTLQTALKSDVASSVGLQLLPDDGAGSSKDPLGSLDHISWNFSLLDFTADLSNLGDLGALGNYPSSPFLPSDSDILLDSQEQEDIVEEFFVDSVPAGQRPSDEDNS